MFELITKSSIRRKIIVLFVYHQEKEFYLSEIARTVGTTAGTARRELSRLIEADFLKFNKRGNLSLYRVNASYALFAEVEAIIRKTAGIEIELKKELGKIEHIRFAFIYGSYAKGDWRSDSDIDLFIIGRPAEDRIFQAVTRIGNATKREIDYHIASETEFAEFLKTRDFYQEISKKPLMLIGSLNEFKNFAR